MVAVFLVALGMLGQNLWAQDADAAAKQQAMQEKAAARKEVSERLRQLNAIRVAQIPWYDLVRYPEDWPAKMVSSHRGVVTRQRS